MRVLGVLAAAPLLLSLQGCWFVFIPVGAIATAGDKLAGVKGEHCVHKDAKVGDTITLPGNGRGRVLSLHGENWRCKNPAHPIRAELDLEPIGAPREPVPRQPADQNPEAIRPPA